MIEMKFMRTLMLTISMALNTLIGCASGGHKSNANKQLSDKEDGEIMGIADQAEKASKRSVFQDTTQISEIKYLEVSGMNSAFRNFYKNWDKYSNQEKIAFFNKKFKEDKYVGYFFAELAKNYFYTKNDRINRMLGEVADFVEQNYAKNGGLLTPDQEKEGHWYRETFARNGRLMFDAYRYSNNQKILQLLERQVDLWMKEKNQVSYKGFKIFKYSAKLDLVEINPNQNVQMALLFSDLYFNKEGKFYLNPDFRSIAYNEIESALSIVKENGFMPLSEKHMKVGDSNYAGLSTIILYELVQMWAEPAWIEKLQLVGKWLYTAFNKTRPWNTKADGEDYHFDRQDSYNLYARIPAFFAAGISAEEAKSWMDFIVYKYPDFDPLGEVPRWSNLQTIPEDYYSRKQRSYKLPILPPAIYAFQKDNELICNIVSDKIRETKLIDGNQRVTSLKDGISVQLVNKDNSLISVIDYYGQQSSLPIDNRLGKGIKEIKINFFDSSHPISDKK